MKYNKGFAPVLILIIVLGVLVVGGVAYFAGKSSAPKNELGDNSNYSPTTEQNSNLPITSNTNNNVTPPVTSQPKIVTLDLSSSFALQYKGRLTEAFKKPANFNGHYVVADAGCGTGCFTFVVIDKNNGKIYPAPIINDIGEFRGDIGEPYNLQSNQIKIIADNGSKIKTYVFTGSSFSLLSSENSQSFETTARKICSNAGMNVAVPNQSNYQCNTDVAAVYGNTAVAVGVGYKSNLSSISGKQVVTIYKYSNQVVFNESIPQGQYTGYILKNSNYSISGTVGNYYYISSQTSDGDNLIVVPSKLITVLVSPASFVGIPQTTLDSIVNSISF